MHFWIYSQSLSTAPEPRMRIAGDGKSGDTTESIDRIHTLGGLIQEVEVFDLFGSSLQQRERFIKRHRESHTGQIL